jgi:hypothetical protein
MGCQPCRYSELPITRDVSSRFDRFPADPGFETNPVWVVFAVRVLTPNELNECFGVVRSRRELRLIHSGTVAGQLAARANQVSRFR